ncbi:PREDICTED: putative leucine-rich repeat-containing protein DDB_G0290503 isoform X1 [Lupinus angustifolius]|uniref:putative leucine-rich repeat-containing protein DDB_G0290503 isoform X1 n=2 Tax=Lupinus angustifolius TaxID=3871 RepID=UPI00092F21B9|nr:PREDICTED: putative leucine-rich repeat-containing protein DDB_G0290503 isoform X1 [Lupinus angustifolius]
MRFSCVPCKHCNCTVYYQPGKMFKSWSKKKKIKAVFKLDFQATQVPKMKKSALMVSLVPDDVGKPTVKLEKTSVQDGTCLWENPVFESVKLVRDSKSGKLHEKIYHFIVSTGSSKSGFLGEASIDFADFVAEIEPLTVSLPLKFANSGIVLHVTIQNVEGYTAERNGEDNESVGLYNDGSLKNQLSFGSADGSCYVDENGQNSVPSKGPVEAIAKEAQAHKRSNTDWSTGSASDGSLGDWTNSLEDNLPRERLKEPSDSNAAENLRSEIASLKRQAELSELELQSLRKQIEKESSRGQNLSRQINSLRDEKDVLKTKYEQLKTQQNYNNESKASKTLKSEIDDTKLQLEATKEELVYKQELSSNLQMQLQKTQNSNSELLLAVTELEAMLEQKNKEISDLSTNIKSRSINKEHTDAPELDLLKHKITDQNHELDICYKQHEDLNDEIKELNLEYELLKKENVDISLRLKQGEAQKIMLQNEHSAALATIQQLELKLERLEEKMKTKEVGLSESLVSINELENEVESLQKELTLQSEKFEGDLHAMECAKIEQEERAIQAEEALRKARHNNDLTSEQFQQEYRMLSIEMSSKVEENEKMTMKAVEEANELRQQNKLIEEMLQKCNQELRLITDQNELKLQQLLNQIDSKGKTIEKMSQELEVKSKQLNEAESTNDEKDAAFSRQIQMLRSEIKKLIAEDYVLSKLKPTKKITEVERTDSETTCEVETLLSEIETFNIRHKDVKHSLQKEQVEKESMKKQISQLEGELKKKEAELSTAEKKLKNNKGRAPVSHMNLTSRDNDCAAPPSAKAHIKKSKSETQKGIDAASKSEGGTIDKSAENKVSQSNASELKTCSADEVNNHGTECDTKELLSEVAALKERNEYMESELKEMEERYSEISLKFAEVEGERQQLVMALRNLKNGKRN